ncbi:Predicted metal-dependent phosphoesterase TrpH, contains PHP domain [Natronoarchaeum philippinense]|uniref:Predicted metal-dependent phosphoesterase TrpH, contains PHP domain n=1 Tax=Natronoarchaeum philippinense TaxID=558529 RepID=A0A285NU94_NATPI|nr:PHP-associated domain-containing protein [Natronoarchaeum philippinense]SNZ13062.1 Predicted metal-dependent phosphoesterase TrpH, contains PHP domain [Natronoarchaeum philippinense]
MSDSEGTRVDMHVKVLDEHVAQRAKDRGIDVLVYAPHFERLPTIRRRAERYTDEDLLVVPAREVFAEAWQSRKHVLAIGLDDPVPDFVTLDGAMAEFRRQDAAVVVPHPEFLSVGMNQSDIEHYADVVDAVEVYNPKHWPHHTRRADRIADAVDRPSFASSYAHLRQTVGAAWTEFDRAIESATALVEALREGVPRDVYRRSGVEYGVLSAAEFAHLGWENSWKKIDRILLSGREATHPRHDAYDGRFDDVAVY